ncbi:MAG TPA: hypothetical protein VFM46_02300 [Pseudomonadales bacterium]|nr:hypothetical protein [Pseudomonadales bacterium]
MSWFVENIQTILLVTGYFTAAVGLFFFKPELGLNVLFKHTNPEPLLVFIFRHWTLLVGTFGILLVISAYNPVIRTHIMVAASVEKAFIVYLVLSNLKSTPFAKWALPAAIVDAACIVCYLGYLMADKP